VLGGEATNTNFIVFGLIFLKNSSFGVKLQSFTPILSLREV
jgi:hypothetical protein